MSPITAPLRPMADGTPLGLERLREGWPFLSFSEKAELLDLLLGPEEPLRWPHQRRKVHDLAQADPNPLIRRLASGFAPRPDGPPGGKHPGTRAEACLAFWTLPRLVRLQEVHGAEDLEWLAAVLLCASGKAVPEGVVGPEEVLDVIVEFFSRGNLEQPAEGDAGCLALWSAVPRLSGPIRELLLAYIPTAGVAKAALEALDPAELQALLRRRDFDPGPSPLVRGDCFQGASREVRAAAMSSPDWCLEDEVIGEALRIDSGLPGTKADKLDDLCLLASDYAGGTLVQLAALRAGLRTYTGELPEAGRVEVIEQRMNSRQSLVSYERLKEEVFELRLWYLACQVAVVDGGADRFPQQLGQGWIGRLEPKRIPGDPWLTYLGLKSEIRSHQQAALVGALPVLGDYEIGTLPPELRGVDPFSERSGDNLVDHARRIASSLPPSERSVFEALSTALAVIHQDVGKVKQGLALAAQQASRHNARIRSAAIVAAGLAIAFLFLVRH